MLASAAPGALTLAMKGATRRALHRLSLSQNNLGEGLGLASLAATSVLDAKTGACPAASRSLRGFVPF
jgi:hypothetical protein